MDKRDLELLVKARVKTPRKYLRLVQGGFIVMAVGIIVTLQGIGNFGIGIAGLGFIAVGIAMVKQDKAFKKRYQEIMDDYNKTGKLMPYPDDVK